MPSVSIDANFANTAAGAIIRGYGQDAHRLRDLYVQMICYCKVTPSDGFVPEGQISVLAHPSSPKAAARDIARLVECGLVQRGVGGYLVPAYLERNKHQSTPEDQSARKAEGARRANHERWHRRRGETDPGCEYCIGTHQSTDQFSLSTDQSTDQFTDDEDQSSDGTDLGGMAELFSTPVPPTGVLPPAGCEKHPAKAHGNCRGCGTSGRDASGEPDSPEFTEFWAVYPIKVGKPRARKAWKAAMKRGHDPALIITAAKAYREEPGRTRQFTAHASTWLNDERYITDPEEDAPDAPGTEPYDWEA